MKSAFVLLFNFIFGTCFALQYGLDAKVGPNCKIKNFQIIAERHSGSNYTESLLQENIVNFPSTHHFGHKHFPLWFERPKEFYQGPDHWYTYEGNENTLFVVVFRNPYDWVRAMHEKPYHSIYEIEKPFFSSFIRKPWRLSHFPLSSNTVLKNLPNQLPPIGALQKINPLMDRDPKDGSPFTNVIKLRNQKIKTMMQIKDRVENIYFVNYETAEEHPEEVIDEIVSLFNLKKTRTFNFIDSYKGKNKKHYIPKKYCSITEGDLIFINSQLDHELEKALGYQLIRNPKNLP